MKRFALKNLSDLLDSERAGEIHPEDVGSLEWLDL
jgi:hypothetical protein